MVRDYSVIAKEAMMPDIKIQIKNLYKIFGSNDKKMISHVEGGMGKTELLDQHGHVSVSYTHLTLPTN